ncbi:hypothetical protein EMCG_07629, partial [[Emmonsia] crescens]
MSSMRFPKWSNDTLSAGVPGRAAGHLVWIPVSKAGVLIAVGEVAYPGEISQMGNDLNHEEQENNQTGPEFMQKVPVYDIDTRE